MSAPRQIRLDNADPATVRTVRRFDIAGELRRPFKRPDGTIIVEGIICREGPLRYRKADGTERIELVTAEAVRATARTAAYSSTTLNHPPGGFVTRQNADRLSTGGVDGETEYVETAQGSFARIKMVLRRDDAITAFEDGTARQLSPGYEVTLDETPGVHPVHGRYDARQIDRVVNHTAQVPKGRGDDVDIQADAADYLRTDADDAYQVSTWQPPEPTTDTPAGNARTDSPEVYMNPNLVRLLALLGVRTDSEEVALTEAITAAEKLRADAEEATEKAAELEKEKEDAPDFAAMEKERDKLKSDMEELQGKHDALFEAAKTAKKEKEDRADAAELTELKELAGRVNVRTDGLDLPQLRHAIAKHHIPDLPDDAGAGYVSGVLASVRADAATPRGSGSRHSGNYNGSNHRNDDNNDNREDATVDEFYNPAKAGAAKQRADAAAGGTP